MPPTNIKSKMKKKALRRDAGQDGIDPDNRQRAAKDRARYLLALRKIIQNGKLDGGNPSQDAEIAKRALDR